MLRLRLFLPPVKLTCLGLLLWPGACNSLQAQSPHTDSLKARVEAAAADTGKVLLLRDLAFDLLISDPAAAARYSEQAMKLAQQLQFAKGIALAADVQGNLLRTRGDYQKALALHLQALHVFDSLGYARGIRSTSVNTGTDYFQLKDYPKALNYYNEALRLTDTSEHTMRVKILNNIGMLYSTLGEHERALQTFSQALPYVNEDASGYAQSSLYSSMAIASGQLGNMNQAVSYMLHAIRYQQQSGNKVAYAGSASTLAGFYIEKKDYVRARHYLDEALRTAREVQAGSVVANYYRNTAHLCAREGKYAQAYQYLNDFIAVNDTLLNETHMAAIAETEARYEVDRKTRELELLGKEKQLQQSDLQLQKQWKLALALALAVLALLLLLVYRNMQLKVKANRVLELEKEKAENQRKDLEAHNVVLQHGQVLAQYETLKNQVNPHFLFNSLNALSSLIKADPQRAMQFTAVFARLYRSVLELKDQTVITLEEEMQLVDDYMYLQKIRFGNNLTVARQIDATSLGLYVPPFCIQMLMENAVKHNIISDEQPLTITLRTEANWLLIENTIRRRQHKTESTGVGIRNIVERYRLLDERLPEFTVQNEIYVARIPLLNPQA